MIPQLKLGPDNYGLAAAVRVTDEQDNDETHYWFEFDNTEQAQAAVDQIKKAFPRISN